MSTIEMPRPDAALIGLKAKVVHGNDIAIGEHGVIHEPEETIAYECDALTAYRCPPLAVCLPASTAGSCRNSQNLLPIWPARCPSWFGHLACRRCAAHR